MKRIFLVFVVSALILWGIVSVSFAVNSYIFSLNTLRVDVKGNTIWESKALIKVEDPSSLSKSIVWRYNPEVANLVVERIRLKRSDGRVELLALDVKDYGSLIEKRASLEGVRSGDIIELSFRLGEKGALPPYFWFYFPYPDRMEMNKVRWEIFSAGGFSSNENFLKGAFEKGEIPASEPFSPPREPLLITSLSSWNMAFPLFAVREEAFSLKEIEEKLSKVVTKGDKLELLWKILSEKKVMEGWSFADQGYAFSPLERIWNRKEVTPSDLSYFIYSVLRKVGLSPEMVWVSRWPLNEKYPVPSLLSHPLIRVVIEDKTYWLDPYALGLPPGYIHPDFQGSKGIIFSFNKAKFVSVPILAESFSSEEANMSIDLSETGDYDFSVKVISKGWLSNYIRRFSELDGVTDLRFGDKGSISIEEIKGKSKLYVDSFGKRIAVSLPSLSFPLEFLGLPLERKEAIDLKFLRKFEHTITLKYPRRWRVVSLPLPFSREEEAFSVSSRFYEGRGNTIKLSYSFRLKKKYLSPEEWVALRKAIVMLEDYVRTQLLFERR
ncbi:MAG: hypothetical protein PWQ16_192 [bacterium]|nr:hypothetical protein [bacterium]